MHTRFLTVLALILAAVLVLTMPLSAMAMPEYSPDGTCAGSDCHAEGEYGAAAAATPAVAETVEETEVEGDVPEGDSGVGLALGICVFVCCAVVAGLVVMSANAAN